MFAGLDGGDDDGDTIETVEDIDRALQKQQQKHAVADKRLHDAQQRILLTGDEDRPESNPDGGDTALLQDILRRTHGTSAHRHKQRRKQQQQQGQRGDGHDSTTEEDAGDDTTATDDESDDDDGTGDDDDDADGNNSDDSARGASKKRGGNASPVGSIPSPKNNDRTKASSRRRSSSGGGVVAGGDSTAGAARSGSGGKRRKSRKRGDDSSEDGGFLPSIMRGVRVDLGKAAQQAQLAAQQQQERPKTLARDARFILSGAVHSSHDAVRKFQAYAAAGNMMQPHPPLPKLPDLSSSHSHRSRGISTSRATATSTTAPPPNHGGRQPQHHQQHGPGTARSALGTASTAVDDDRDRVVHLLFMTECRSPETGALSPSHGSGAPTSGGPQRGYGYGSHGLNQNQHQRSTSGSSSAATTTNVGEHAPGVSANVPLFGADSAANISAGSPRALDSAASPYSLALLRRSVSGGPSIEELLAFDRQRGADRHHQSYRAAAGRQPAFPQLQTKLGVARKVVRFNRRLERSALEHGRYGIGELQRAWEAQHQFRDERRRVMSEVLDNPKLQFVAPQALLQQVRTRMKAAAATKDHRERLDYYFEHIRNVRPHLDVLFPQANSMSLSRQLDWHQQEQQQQPQQQDAPVVDSNGKAAVKAEALKSGPDSLNSSTSGAAVLPLRREVTGGLKSAGAEQQQQQQPAKPAAPVAAPAPSSRLVDDYTLAHRFLDVLQQAIVDRDGVSGLAQLDEIFRSVFQDEHVHMEHVVNLLALVAPLFGAGEAEFLEWIRAKRRLHEHRDRAVMVEMVKRQFGTGADAIDANFRLTVNHCRGAWLLGGYAGGNAETGKRSPVADPASRLLSASQSTRQPASARMSMRRSPPQSPAASVNGKGAPSAKASMSARGPPSSAASDAASASAAAAAAVAASTTGGGVGAGRRSRVALRFRAEDNRVNVTTPRVPIRAAVWEDCSFFIRLQDQRSSISVELISEAEGSGATTVIATGSMTVDGIGWKRPQTVQVELAGLGRGVVSVTIEMEFPSALTPQMRRKLASGVMPAMPSTSPAVPPPASGEAAPETAQQQPQQQRSARAPDGGAPAARNSPLRDHAEAVGDATPRRKRSPKKVVLSA